jgi:regulator of sigma E protease
MIAGQDPLSALGFTPYQPPLKPIIGEVVASGAAAQQGLQVGDTVVMANNHVINTWQDFVEVVRTHPEKTFVAQVERQSTNHNLT